MPSSGALEDRVDRGSQARRGRRRGRARRRRPPPSDWIASAIRAGWCRVPRRAPSIASGARPRIAAIVRGSIVALVSACGIAQHPDERLADHVVKGEAAPSRSRRRRGASPSASASAVARRLGLVERRGDQLGAAERRQGRDRVGERPVERLGAVREGVHRRWPGAKLVEAGHLSPGRRPRAPAAPGAGLAARPSGAGGWSSSRRPRAWSGSRRPARRGPPRSPSRRRSPGRRRARRASGVRTASMIAASLVDGARRGAPGGRALEPARASSIGRRASARGVVRSSKRSQACRARISARPRTPLRRKTIVRSPSRQVKSISARHRRSPPPDSNRDRPDLQGRCSAS